MFVILLLWWVQTCIKCFMAIRITSLECCGFFAMCSAKNPTLSMHILVTSEPQLIKQNIFTIEMLKRLILFVCRTGIIRTLKQVRSRGSRTKREEGRDSRRRRFQGTARTGTSPASCRRYTRVETKTSRRLKYIG